MLSPERRHDVYFITSAQGFSFRNSNCGVTVRDDGLAWVHDERQDEVNFSNIVAVHLQTGGDWRNPLNICEITLRDGYKLTVTSGGSLGSFEEAQAPIFRAFIQDFHDRLVVAGRTDIAFTAGLRQINYVIVLVCSILLGVMALGIPLVILIWKDATEALWLLPGGAFLIWPLAKMVSRNAPRTYNPRSLPEELLT
jgi:hypothetical protein